MFRWIYLEEDGRFMKGIIDNYNFVEMDCMRYWSYPAAQASKQHDEVYNYIMSHEYIGALKVDGYYQRIVKDEDGQCFMIARNRNVHGEVINKLDWLPHIKPWLDKLPNGTCFLCECYLPGNEGSKNITSILGCLKDKAIARQKEHKLHLYVFDCMAYDNVSYMNTPYEDRARKVQELSHMYTSEYIDYARYYIGKALWDHLQDYLASGREGMVIMRRDAVVYTKRTPARVSIKVKKELQDTIDCVVIGANPPTHAYTGKEIETWPYWENLRTGEKLDGNHYKEYQLGEGVGPITKGEYYGWCGSLQLGLYDEDHRCQHIGDLSGITDEVKANWRDYVGKVCEVGGMEIMDTGGIRHPKFLGWREDKAASACTIDQLKI